MNIKMRIETLADGRHVARVRRAIDRLNTGPRAMDEVKVFDVKPDPVTDPEIGTL